ncbi:29726_t:CDS:2, partial [Gigaspora margarita]
MPRVEGLNEYLPRNTLEALSRIFKREKVDVINEMGNTVALYKSDMIVKIEKVKGVSKICNE